MIAGLVIGLCLCGLGIFGVVQYIERKQGPHIAFLGSMSIVFVLFTIAEALKPVDVPIFAAPLTSMEADKF